MNGKTELQRVSEETYRFMRGKYALDEVPGKYYDIDCLKFRQGKRTILSINLHEDHYDFQIIFGKAEREKFEARRAEFTRDVQDIYDNSRILPDGKWMLIRVDNMAALENVKKLILIKKNPNRKPFPKEQAVYADCGNRCDLCIHYAGGTISDELREELKVRLTRVFNAPGTSVEDGYWGKGMKFCNGCGQGGLSGKHDCVQKKCLADKNIANCIDCGGNPCEKSTLGPILKIEARSFLADDVTWAILPFVEGQYGN